jgi:hypothetical protein
MARQGISTGSSPNDGTGDTLLEGAVKINSNFIEIYSSIGNGSSITNSIAYSSSSGISTYSQSSGIATNAGYATTSGISTLSRGLTGIPSISVSSVNSSGIITSAGGFITSSDVSGGSVQLIVSGSILTLNVVGVGSTNLNLY